MALTLDRGVVVPVAGSSDHQNVTAAELNFDTTMVDGELYMFTSSVNVYLRQGAAPTASAADGSFMWPANLPLLIDAREGAKLSVVRVASDGVATLQRLRVIR